ncbi:MAG: site-specific DNA-methyltransferase [Chloroflexi bacterium]|jgi:DNA modification methylase|nr:site-specific DNA-methyltransferase [Chloroflexota bacterium]
MSKRKFRNRLNDLDTKEWLKFQKSWFVHNPPPRKKDVLQHPAKYPETLVQEFIEFFTKQEGVVFDPMAGTGSTLIAALRAGRHSYGIELNPAYAKMARQMLLEERQALGDTNDPLIAEVVTGNSTQIATIFPEYDIPPLDYVITSPPYWDMLSAKGAETQKKRRGDDSLDVVYSDHPDDLGNIPDYEHFLNMLVRIYIQMKPFLKPRAYITIIVKNVKKGGKMYPLAWDLARRLDGTYTLKDEKIWCQDNIRLFPYGMGNAWVSNTFHHYCLQFRNE